MDESEELKNSGIFVEGFVMPRDRSVSLHVLNIITVHKFLKETVM